MNTLPPRHARAQSGGILSKLLFFLLVLFALGAAAWVFLLPGLVAAQIHSKTGFTLHVDHLSINPFTANASIKGLVLKNPDDWPATDFIDLREFKAEANLMSVFSNRVVASEVVIDVARCTLVKNQQGVFNATAFTDALKGPNPASQPQAKGPAKEFLIKHLVLKFDQLVYADYSAGKPVTREYKLNVNEELRDVDSVAKIIKPITAASIGTLTDALSGALNGRTDLLKDVSGALRGAGKKTGEKLKGLLDALDKKKP